MCGGDAPAGRANLPPGHDRSVGAVPRRSVSSSDVFDVPVLVIFGNADRRRDPSSAHLYDTVPNARVEWLPDVGHFPMLEAPETTSELLLAFAAADR